MLNKQEVEQGLQAIREIEDTKSARILNSLVNKFKAEERKQAIKESIASIRANKPILRRVNSRVVKRVR